MIVSESACFVNYLDFCFHLFTMNVLLYWYEETKWSVQSLKAIEEPRLPYESYKPGMKVNAKYQGRLYPCVILGISGNNFILPFISFK